MKLILSILAALLIGGSLLADYKWRQWMNTRRQERDTDIRR
jgi:hypothetical protein